MPEIDAQQIWFDEAQRIASDFVQEDHELGEVILDRCERYWDECFWDGLTPEQALNRLIALLQGRRS